MRHRPYLLLLLLLASCSPQPDHATAAATSDPGVVVTTGTTPPGIPAEVVRVFDGDSLLVTLNGGVDVEVRLLGVNAPEGSECHGDAARDTLEQLVESGPLFLVEDLADTDQFDRLLRYLYVDGLNLNLAMIANGDAIVLQGDHSLDGDFTEIADAAAEAGIGMWAPDACGNTPPPQSMTIVDYVYNPAGRDSDNRNGEWVAIANDGLHRVDMSEWILRDESTQHRYRFPDGFGLDSGADVVVHSGCGNDSTTDLYWCAADPVWSNGGDTIILHLPSGTVVARDRYEGDF